MIIFEGLRLVIVISMLLSSTICSNDIPTTIVAYFGDTLQLDCIFNKVDTFYVVWKHNDKSIIVHDGKKSFEKKSIDYTSRFFTERNIYQLHKIINATEDFGSYVCVQIPSKGLPQKTAWILRSRYYSYLSNEGNATADVGSTVILECFSQRITPVNIHWKHDGVRILQHQADHSFQETKGKYIPRMVGSNMSAQLEIRNVTLEDTGNYSCLLSDASRNSFRTSWTLHVTEGSLQDDKISALIGTSVSLPCSLLSASSNITVVRWNHGSNEILHHNTRNKSIRKGKYTSVIANDKSVVTLEIHVVGSEDAGQYSCSAFLQKGLTLQSNWIITIQGKQVFEGEIFLFVGNATRLKCNVDKSANETYKWTHDTEVVNDGVNNNEKIIVNASFKDAGIYSCFSYSKKNGNIQTRWTLQVQGNVYVTLNKSLLLENDTLLSKCCVAFGLKPENPKIEWLLNGKTSHFNYSTPNCTEENKTITFCSNMMFRVNRSYHGQSLDCLVQDQRKTSGSALLQVFYPPNILNIRRHPPSYEFFLSLLSNKDDFLACSVDANPEPEVKLEKKSSSGNWKELPHSPNFHFANSTISEWNFPLWSIGKGTYRCSAFNDYGIAAPSLEIDIKCVSFCVFDSLQGFVLTMIVICVGVIVVIALIIKIVTLVKEKRLRNNVSTVTVRAQNNEQTETVLLDAIYENSSNVHTTRHERQLLTDGPADELIGEENYSLVTIKEQGQLETQEQNKKIRRKPTPKAKSKRRREKGHLSYQSVNGNQVHDYRKKNTVYATVQKDKSVTQDLYATVQKEKSTSTKPYFSSSNEDAGASTNLTKAEIMYAKVKKNKIWRSEL